MRTAKQTLIEWFNTASITLNGNNPYDIQICDERFYDRIMSEGLLGLGESYMDGHWDCQELDEFIYRVLRAGLEEKVASIKNLVPYIRAVIYREICRRVMVLSSSLNCQSIKSSGNISKAFASF